MAPEQDGFQERFQKEDMYYEEIAHSVWLMNDHRWALLGWEKSCKMRPAMLVHLDWHWDGINDFKLEAHYQTLLKANSFEKLENLIAKDSLVRRDSFIAPAVIRGITDEIHFFCLQDDTEPGLDPQLLQRYGAKEIRHDSIRGLRESLECRNKTLIMDLDLDLFNRDTPFYAEGTHFSENIKEFIEECRPLIQKAEVATIAKSPSAWWIGNQSRWDWDPELSEELASIVVPRILKIRGQ